MMTILLTNIKIRLRHLQLHSTNIENNINIDTNLNDNDFTENENPDIVIY